MANVTWAVDGHKPPTAVIYCTHCSATLSGVLTLREVDRAIAEAVPLHHCTPGPICRQGRG